MKRIISLILTCLLALSLAVPAAAYSSNENVQPYVVGEGTAIKDAQPGQWYYEYARWALSLGLFDLSGRSYLPETGATRTDLVSALYKYAVFLGLDISAGKDTNVLSYKDATEIKEGKYEAWQWACGAGLILGVQDYLRPNTQVTREYMIFLLYRFASMAGAATTEYKDIKNYKDASEIQLSNKEFEWAVGAGIIKGTTDSTLSPNETASRAQLAAVLYRYNSKFGKEHYVNSEIIELYGNPTTGYSWVVDKYDEKIINVSELMYIQDNTDLVGSGGTFGYSIKGVSEGTARLSFRYIRSWDSSDSKPVNYVTYEVKVKPDLTISVKAIG